MVNECSESYRNGQELSNVYTYLRHDIPHLLPRLLLAPPALSTSSLQWFIPAECFSCCFVLPFPVCGCDDDLRATLLCTTQLKNFLCEQNLHNNNAKENKKFWRLGTTGQKNTKSCADLCTLLNARHGRRAYNEDDDRLVSYSLDKENYGKQKLTVKVDSDYYSDRKGFLMSILPFLGVIRGRIGQAYATFHKWPERQVRPSESAISHVFIFSNESELAGRNFGTLEPSKVGLR